MQKVIDAAVKRKIAIEINDHYKIPGAKFIKLAKKSGAKFSFGTNNAETSFGDFFYCKEMIKECNLQYSDMFQPKCLKEYLSKEK
jgi:histidinol phosphatase-like PHP family hydrolase